MPFAFWRMLCMQSSRCFDYGCPGHVGVIPLSIYCGIIDLVYIGVIPLKVYREIVSYAYNGVIPLFIYRDNSPQL